VGESIERLFLDLSYALSGDIEHPADLLKRVRPIVAEPETAQDDPDLAGLEARYRVADAV
jgi:hypothetical protein